MSLPLPLLCLVGMAALPRPATGVEPPAAEKPTPEQIEFFETKVRPVLAESCYSCHGKDAQLAGLRVDSRAAMLKGGDSGPALLPGDPVGSLLIKAVRHFGRVKMPQGGKLPQEKVEALAAWVKMGAPWPETPADAAATAAANTGTGEYKLTPEQRKFWSFQPVRKPAVPKVKNTAWVTNPIDAFVLAKLEAKGFAPAPPADKRTLLRRVTFDLTGLPPTPAEMDAFLTDKSPNAYEKVVDRLLASPRYGERWARHWLDIARYSDTKGYVFNEDRNYYNAYTYRDFVIRALNEDLPYDRFIMYQLAADLMPEVQNGDDKRPLAALGFLTVGRRFLNARPDIMDDRIDVTMRGFQGLTVGCARCHDHKFDPVPAKDYYSLYGVFDSCNETEPPISPKEISEPYMAHDEKVRKTDEEINNIIRTQVKRLRQMVKDPSQETMLSDEVKKALQSVRENEQPNGKNLETMETAFVPEQRDRLKVLRAEVETLRKTYPPKPEFAMAIADKGNGSNVRVFKRGNPGTPGDEAPRRFLLALTPEGKERALWTKGSGRLELAKSIATKDNPLTARVMVNRVWLHHFGQGIVRTPSDFGKQGEKPTHPELLDYLASWFVDNNWSLKKLHKHILMSSAYRQSSAVSPKMAMADPENRLIGRMNRRRLDLEQMRDALLHASGKLDTAQVGGKSVELWQQPFNPRRAVYGFIERQNLPQIFKTFDFASPDSTSPQRFKTTVPQQALFLMNSPFAAEQARNLARRSEVVNAKDDGQRVRRMYLLLYNRLPDAEEEKLAIDYVRQESKPMERETPTWQNGYGTFDEAANRVNDFAPLPHFNGKAWQGGPNLPDPKLSWLTLNPDGGHPSRTHAVIRRWTAPRDVTINIAGRLKHPDKNGNGVRARIVSNRQGKLGEWTAHNNEMPVTLTNIAVRKGETLDFLVDANGDEGFDGFTWSPVVRAESKALADAKKDFRGPLAAPLARWEQYAQALLLTNEFLFVD